MIGIFNRLFGRKNNASLERVLADQTREIESLKARLILANELKSGYQTALSTAREDLVVYDRIKYVGLGGEPTPLINHLREVKTNVLGRGGEIGEIIVTDMTVDVFYEPSRPILYMDLSVNLNQLPMEDGLVVTHG